MPTAHLGIDWTQFAALVSAIGALGIAAYGLVEALGKTFAVVYTEREPAERSGRRGRLRTVRLGLPYVGFSTVRKMAQPLGPALDCAYGANYLEIISQQYRADRGKGRAPDMIREGVKLGLPFLPLAEAAAVIDSVWRMEPGRAMALARALSAEPPATGAGDADKTAQLLAGRFATALDARVAAAFTVAEERYEAYAKCLAGVAAVGLALAFNLSLNPRFPWSIAVMIGIVAVPLAPVANDLANALQNALTAFKAIPNRRV